MGRAPVNQVRVRKRKKSSKLERTTNKYGKSNLILKKIIHLNIRAASSGDSSDRKTLKTIDFDSLTVKCLNVSG